MSKQIHTKFASSEYALEAQDYLRNHGIMDVTVEGNYVMIETTDENWISAFELTNSLGGTFEGSFEILNEVEQQYNIDPGIKEQEVNVDIVDPEAFVDVNLGYGDYEIIEPYILHRYNKMVNEVGTDET